MSLRGEKRMWRREQQEKAMFEKEDDRTKRAPLAEAYRHILGCALDEVHGDKQELCRRLWISSEELEEYQSGRRPVPFTVFVGAFDIVLSAIKTRRG
jgi:hypothetical protein